jgi:ABC transport system ATP-binding/permease protein
VGNPGRVRDAVSLVRLTDATLAFGHKLLLDRATLQIDERERVCLVGRNGTGKSTLLNVLRGTVAADDGLVWRREALRIAQLEQDVPEDLSATVYQTVAAGLPEIGRVLADYHDASHAIAADDSAGLRRIADLQQRIDALDGWNLSQRVETVLSRFALPPDLIVGECSGGTRRRVMLARALVSEPELLLLDEPTNHMDIDAITALEELLLAFHGATVFVTHDRTLIRRLATRIVELDRGQLVSFPGDYDQYLARKQQMLDAEARENANFDKFLAEEEIWIRQGIKARRTRNEGRVRRLESLREARRQRVARQGTISLDVDSSARSGQIVTDLDGVSFGYGDRQLVQDLTLTVRRGDRIGIIGPNGCGKSTLLRLILGELAPLRGHIRTGTKLATAYFDQQRAQLDPDKTVRENVGDGAESVTIGGRSKHVIGYLGDFLFPPERANSPVASLSGGERNRLLLAKLFTQPANLLVFDEPTNDLDAETLELLEELLAEFTGTLLLVSHDRSFIDNVVTSIVAFEGNGVWGEYVGGYQDWLRQTRAVDAAKSAAPAVRRAPPKPAPAKRRLSFKEQRELDALPQTIEALETHQAELQQRIAQPDFYRQDKAAIAEILARLEDTQSQLAAAYARWESLEQRS